MQCVSVEHSSIILSNILILESPSMCAESTSYYSHLISHWVHSTSLITLKSTCFPPDTLSTSGHCHLSPGLQQPPKWVVCPSLKSASVLYPQSPGGAFLHYSMTLILTTPHWLSSKSQPSWLSSQGLICCASHLSSSSSLILFPYLYSSHMVRLEIAQTHKILFFFSPPPYCQCSSPCPTHSPP